MTAMSGTPATRPLLPPTGEWTVADLESLPDDGRRYELLDGMLFVSAAPVPLHQRVQRKLLVLLDAACPDSMEVFGAPLDWQPDLATSLQPDLLVVRSKDIGDKNITRPLLLALEILSPSTRRYDLLTKRSKYEDSGVESYWVADPLKPSLTAFQLVGGHYQIVAAYLDPKQPILRRLSRARSPPPDWSPDNQIVQGCDWRALLLSRLLAK